MPRKRPKKRSWMTRPTMMIFSPVLREFREWPAMIPAPVRGDVSEVPYFLKAVLCLGIQQAV